MKKIIIGTVLLAAIGGFVIFCGPAREQSNRISFSGNIELNEVQVAFKTAGRLIERLVNEGDKVEKGQVLARIDGDQLLRQRDRDAAALKLAGVQLEQARTAAEWQRRTLAADVAQRRAELESVTARYRELQSGSRPQEIREAKAAVAAAQAEAERATHDWQRAQKLYKDDDISTAQFDQFRNRYEGATAALKQAQERASLVEAGLRAETVEAARGQVARAQASLRAGEANQLELDRREQEIAARRAEIERAKAQTALIDSQLADTVAVSPVSGVVLVKAADAGEVLAPGTTVVTVGDIEHPWLRGYVGERDLGRVKLGQKVRVRTDSYPGKDYWGRVSFISSEAEFTPKQIQTKEERVKLVYRIKVDIDNPHRELKSNMPADAEILLEP